MNGIYRFSFSSGGSRPPNAQSPVPSKEIVSGAAIVLGDFVILSVAKNLAGIVEILQRRLSSWVRNPFNLR
jgi:hypothetical protein